MNHAVAATDGPSPITIQCQICSCMFPLHARNIFLYYKAQEATRAHVDLTYQPLEIVENCCSATQSVPQIGRNIMSLTGQKFRIATSALVLSSIQALACSFDTDCSPGSKCVRPSGQVIGMCTGGQFPGNRYDKSPYRDPFDPNRTVGKTCSFNIECGPGNHCQMGLGTYGVCVRP